LDMRENVFLALVSLNVIVGKEHGLDSHTCCRKSRQYFSAMEYKQSQVAAEMNVELVLYVAEFNLIANAYEYSTRLTQCVVLEPSIPF
jgi:hypothetical protein